MAGGVAVPMSNGRVRIKGRAKSAIRFFLIAVSFAMPFVLITSLLGYYSLWFGPQILLELTLAFYVPSIPVLIILGQIEGPMAAWLGPTSSALCRLLVGLLGCTLVAGAFPFLPSTHASLLWLTAALGTVSSIAFSTSYQVVQWFRHADIIALGLGGVTSGPLVLVLQLALGVGPLPERWQWVAMFEVTAGITILGTFAAASLFAQYWNIMSGKEEYIDPRTPLLGGITTEQQAAEEEEEEGVMQLARAATERIVLTPDPFSSLPLLGEGGSFRRLRNTQSVFARHSSLLHRCNSIGSCSHLPVQDDYHLLHHPPLVPNQSAPQQRLHRFSSAKEGHDAGMDANDSAAPTPLSQRVADLEQRRLQHAQQQQQEQQQVAECGGSMSHSLDLAASTQGQAQHQGHEYRSQGFSDPSYQRLLTNQIAGSAVNPATPTKGGGQQQRGDNKAAVACAPCNDHGASNVCTPCNDEPTSNVCTPCNNNGAFERARGAEHLQENAGIAGGCHAGDAAGVGSEGHQGQHKEGGGPKRKLTLHQENMAVWAGAWPVLVAFFISVSVLYLVFPFFTYVPTSGKLGKELPQVMFFGRIFADIVGRFAPRRKALMVRAPMALLTLGGIKVGLSLFFFLYIKLIALKFKSDILISSVVILLWLLGGYINTSSNILAPSLVATELVGRASAILALAFQIAHFAGLLLAVIMAYILYGDVVG
mmetsp:Transcript_15218/g.40145  ORF Transcript_15218/g.40145 Transcript_15218/m.40145 type:complete len:706 (+) Transcript_15218:67-2184(+)|eukprot:CAMPEP_0202381436 /NCGR_PEP_ID=MMETSP1127-20130417/35654_1 /ASSEMBLY_ACC=CAM_ASM_000462 /TAXON_ID=3047 /ORGANISM="Dunaliella tertiolecta, Strain CCMP1320" /LENGTH=705 /DNA_ID=CAMNT_0048980389 /DNA_START=14 /DNA_END=2131 /DNA_ORIENTATION=-